MRYFVGLDLPEDLKARLASLQSGVPQTRWVDAQGFHLTLAFLGELDGFEFDKVAKLFGTLTSPAFQLRLAGLDRFGNGRKTRVIWAGVEPNPCLETLATQLRTKLSFNAINFDHRKFSPHVTLSRHCTAKLDKVAEYLGANAGFMSSFFDVSEFHLFSSHLTSSGAFYRKELTVPLQQLMAD